jgi:hypothetical protein
MIRVDPDLKSNGEVMQRFHGMCDPSFFDNEIKIRIVD